MNKEQFSKILQGCMLLYEGNTKYWIKHELNLTESELNLCLKVFKTLRWVNPDDLRE